MRSTRPWTVEESWSAAAIHRANQPTWGTIIMPAVSMVEGFCRTPSVPIDSSTPPNLISLRPPSRPLLKSVAVGTPKALEFKHDRDECKVNTPLPEEEEGEEDKRHSKHKLPHYKEHNGKHHDADHPKD